MKKFLAVLLAATVLAAPIAQAQSHSRDKSSDRNRPVAAQNYSGKAVAKKPQVSKRWNRGQRISASQRRNVIDRRDYRRYNLSAPRQGQRWVRVDNQYLLINFATGMIVAMASGR